MTNTVPIKHFALAFCLIFTFCAGSVAANPSLDVPKIRIQAQSYILLDVQTNQILAQNDPDTNLAPASLTKIMTLYLIAEHLSTGAIQPEDEVTVSTKAWKTGGSRMFIEAGKKVSVNKLIEGIAVVSGNDATIAITEFIAGSEERFVELMNKKAKQLGMKNTFFTNVTGLPNPKLQSSARDLALLSRALIKKFPHFYNNYFSKKTFSHNNIDQLNRNKLLWVPNLSVDGIKTGHTEEAGYNLAVSAVQKDMRLIAILFGTESESNRNREGEKLLRWGFRYFRLYHLYDALTSLTTSRVWMGDKETISLGVAEPIDMAISKARTHQVSVRVQIQEFLSAPVSIGQQVGELLVYIGKDEHSRYPLIALDTINQGGLFSRFFDWIDLQIHRIFN